MEDAIEAIQPTPTGGSVGGGNGQQHWKYIGILHGWVHEWKRTGPSTAPHRPAPLGTAQVVSEVWQKSIQMKRPR